MRILDLDLDLFLNNVAYHKVKDERLPSSEYSPWKAEQVSKFLETGCGLSSSGKIPGQVVVHHDQAFDVLSELIAKGLISAPFEIVHVDAHADLGMGDHRYIYLLSEFLHIQPELRSREAQRDMIREGNWISFALACRWISKLTYVKHPKSGNDLMPYLFKDFDINSGIIQLRKLKRNAFDNLAVRSNVKDFAVLEFEPEVVFETAVCDSYQASEPFDFVILSESPRYTPKDSDTLIPVISQYFTTPPSRS